MGRLDDAPALVALSGEDRLPSGPTWERLEDQLKWYDRKSGSAQRAYKRVKVTELVVAATIPVAAGAGLPARAVGILGALGALIVVLEGVQHLFQWQQSWILYRATAEALKTERYLFLAEAGPYTGDDRVRVLAERVEELVSQEHTRWVEARDRTEGHTAGADGQG